MKKVKQAISIEKSVFTLNANGQKLTLSIEDLRTLRFVIDQKLGNYTNYSYGILGSPYSTSTAYLSATNNTINALADTTITGNGTLTNTASISIGEENE
jgi:hypothetical protein